MTTFTKQQLAQAFDMSFEGGFKGWGPASDCEGDDQLAAYNRAGYAAGQRARENAS
ncbi:hypothetical protein KDJ57_gp03 [Gordonia phage Catfish]|uniref:Uncharacterized protein n=1 Tax=Gordonia phage Catfish TaxID=2301538 RepID=A0A385D1J5_9CAUD|nr:hypothetical protein KDJ57_gp03 [Gordonia phage Catfish]AXQ51840.1 hypothetical protein SEA_CATFISH_3 [Gordonia phage Catfish]